MGQSKELAQMTIKDLKEHHPDYYNQLHSKCRVCQNIIGKYKKKLGTHKIRAFIAETVK